MHTCSFKRSISSFGIVILILLGAYIFRDIILKSPVDNAFNDLSTPKSLDFSGATAQLPSADKITLWLRAGDLTKQKDNTDVTHWTDAGPMKIVFEPLSSAKNPVFKKNAVHGHPAVFFADGAFLEAWSVIGRNLLSNDSITAFMVFKPNDPSKTGKIQDIFGWGDCVSERFLVHLHGGTYIFQHGDPLHHTEAHPAKEPYDKYHLAVFNKTADESSIDINGFTEATSRNPNKLDLDRQSIFNIGTSSCGQHFNGEIAEFILIRDLTQQERLAAMLYLSEKYALMIETQ